ncbi:MAG: hypothetical protein ACTSVV_15125 [Promethearchaeota archaeon]
MESKRNISFNKEITELVKEGKLDDAVEYIKKYLDVKDEGEYLDRLEEVIETVSTLHGGRTVIRFLIENSVIDIPSLLKNLSKRDQFLRYSFLLLLKSMCENESDLFLPYSENLLNSDDPNVREAELQLLIFMAGGDGKIEDESLIKNIASKLLDDKDFIAEKAVQALKAIGKKSPELISNILKSLLKECPENESLKKRIEEVLKSLIILETEQEVEPKEEKKPVEVPKVPKDTEELKSAEPSQLIEEHDIEKKRQQIEEKEKELELKELELKEKALKLKEELLEKENKLAELSQVELELKEKEIKDKEEQLRVQEAKRIEQKLELLEEMEKRQMKKEDDS